MQYNIWLTSTIAKLHSLQHDHPTIFVYSKMCALKFYYYFEIRITNNGLVFHHEIFHVYSVLFPTFTDARILIIFNHGEVTDLLA